MKQRNIILGLLAAGSIVWFNTASTPATATPAVNQPVAQQQTVPSSADSRQTPYQQPYAPNGTYVNTDGNSLPRPYVSDSVPVGATAQCYDGTYSFSQHRRGTCSHHGGVADWL